jgi:hypothetical protein
MIVLLASLAWAGSADGEVGLDVLTAQSRSTEAKSGPEEKLGATELGVRVRSSVEVTDRFGAEVDYQGREPLMGEVPNSALRLLYEGHLRFGVVPERLDVSVGRFVAPSAVFLPVDGARATWSQGPLEISAFGGRRAITTSRRNVPLGDFLPAAGLSAAYSGPIVRAELLAAWAGDIAVYNTGSDENTAEYEALNVLARVNATPSPAVSAGAQVAFAEQASYVLGPTWADANLTVEALGLWNALGWVAWEPRDDVRLDTSAQIQHVGVYRAGTISGETLTEDDAAPTFADLRVAAAYAPLQRGWIRAEQRYRHRSDRVEWRTGLGFDANDLEVPGLFAKGRLWLDVLKGDAASWAPSVDRIWWTASAGWRKGGFEVEGGTSRVDRAALPVSGRVSDAASPGSPDESEDLSPFVLETQDVAFVRSFWAGKQYFAGVDLERSLHDAELRAMIQVGAIGAVGW